MSTAIAVDVAVVGAGPAGLAAARAARRLGATTLVLDEYATPGGQYHRAPAIASDAFPLSPEAREGREQAATAQREGVAFWQGATVWAAFPDGVLSVDRGDHCAEVHAKRLVLATGAHDRVMPFPGWTLPGVITVGAAQALVKAHAVLPGRRIVVAGSGPFLLVVALELARAGAQVELLEAARANLASFAAFLRFPERWRELASLLAALQALDVSIRTRRVVTYAEGTDRVERVVSRRVDERGAPVAGSDQVHIVDALAVAYGFRVQSELAQLLGCASRYDEAAGGQCVIVDPDTGRTSLEAVFAAGEITGLAGREVAAAEGTIAGTSAAISLRSTNTEVSRLLGKVRARRRRAQDFADLVARTFAPALGLDALVTADTVVCRCEGVTRASIEQAVDAGAHTTSAVKRWTRCGMGRCQSRICGWPLARLVAARLQRPLHAIDNFTARLPVKPVVLANVRTTKPG